MQDHKQANPDPGIQQIIGVYDALSARIADQFGFDWLHVGGYNISGSQFAMPDVGLLTLSENLDAVRKIVQCTSRPVMVDGRSRRDICRGSDLFGTGRGYSKAYSWTNYV